MDFLTPQMGPEYVFIGGTSDVISPNCGSVSVCAQSYSWTDGTPWDFQDGDPVNTGTGWTFAQQMRSYETAVFLYVNTYSGDWGTLRRTSQKYCLCGSA